MTSIDMRTALLLCFTSLPFNHFCYIYGANHGNKYEYKGVAFSYIL